MALKLLWCDISLVLLEVSNSLLNEIFLLCCGRSLELLNHVCSIKPFLNLLDTIFKFYLQICFLALSLRVLFGMTVAVSYLLFFDTIHFETWRPSPLTNDQVLRKRVFSNLLTLEHAFLDHAHFHDLPLGLLFLDVFRLSRRFAILWVLVFIFGLFRFLGSLFVILIFCFILFYDFTLFI